MSEPEARALIEAWLADAYPEFVGADLFVYEDGDSCAFSVIGEEDDEATGYVHLGDELSGGKPWVEGLY